jgi:hypothetical protein
MTTLSNSSRSDCNSGPSHPAELTLKDIAQMDRGETISTLLIFNEYCFFNFTRKSLEQMPNAKLRLLLVAARRHYQAKGY